MAFRRLLVAGIVVAAGLCGCEPRRSPSDFRPPPTDPAALAAEQDHLMQAMGFLNRLEQYDAVQAHDQILYHLNEWLAAAPDETQWIADPLASRLPARLAEFVAVEDLARRRFDAHDVLMLREARWTRDLARWIVEGQRQRARRMLGYEQAALGEAATWLEEVRSVSGDAAADDLFAAMALFDWTVRNVQLDPTPEEPREMAGPGEDAAGEGERTPRLRPGARLHAWEALLFGHGDAMNRARVFLLLARQHGIDVVLLRMDDGRIGPRHLAAAMIGNELYLFDPALGVPLPGPRGRGVATLQQLRADHDLLRPLHFADQPYLLTREAVQNAVALVDATPAALSRRMRILERALSGDWRLALTAAPSTLAQRLRAREGIRDVQIWTAPYEAFRYRRALAGRPEEARALFAEHQLFENRSTLARGRMLHFRGEFDQSVDRPGAKTLYLQSRPADREIQRIASPSAQGAAGVEARLPADPAARRAALAYMQQQMQAMKHRATVWLGMIAYETGQHDVAVHYFDKLTLQDQPEGLLAPAAQYNLARTLELQGLTEKDRGKVERAIHLYLTDASPQAHGSRVRAEWLKRRLAEWAAPPAEEVPAAGEN